MRGGFRGAACGFRRLLSTPSSPSAGWLLLCNIHLETLNLASWKPAQSQIPGDFQSLSFFPGRDATFLWFESLQSLVLPCLPPAPSPALQPQPGWKGDRRPRSTCPDEPARSPLQTRGGRQPVACDDRGSWPSPPKPRERAGWRLPGRFLPHTHESVSPQLSPGREPRLLTTDSPGLGASPGRDMGPTGLWVWGCFLLPPGVSGGCSPRNPWSPSQHQARGKARWPRLAARDWRASLCSLSFFLLKG